MKLRIAVLLVLVVVAVVLFCRAEFRAVVRAVWQKVATPATVADRLRQYGDEARSRLRPHFTRAQVVYPPKQLVFVGLKDEEQLLVYGAGEDGKFRFVRHYRVLAASGGPGPKLREGDRQVPEGIYSIESQNPNSRFHLSLRIGYPNAFDREQARKEGRTNLGGDIMIHGSSVSIGCLAMGDEAAEDLFVLATDTGLPNISVVLSPVDFRLGKTVPPTAKLPPWTESLYAQLKTRLKELPVEEQK
jgi:murein L,D-transpeptidase YafK